MLYSNPGSGESGWVRKIRSLLDFGEKVWKFLEFVNFLLFLRGGQYRTFLERVLRMKMVLIGFGSANQSVILDVYQAQRGEVFGFRVHEPHHTLEHCLGTIHPLWFFKRFLRISWLSPCRFWKTPWLQTSSRKYFTSQRSWDHFRSTPKTTWKRKSAPSVAIARSQCRSSSKSHSCVLDQWINIILGANMSSVIIAFRIIGKGSRWRTKLVPSNWFRLKRNKLWISKHRCAQKFSEIEEKSVHL